MLLGEKSEATLPVDQMTDNQGSEGYLPPAQQNQSRELRWSAAFLAVLGYLVVEYMRLPAQYPILQLIDIGKLVVALALLGWVVSPRLGMKGAAVGFTDTVMIFFVLVALASACFAKYQEDAWVQVTDILRWLAIYFVISRIVVSSWRQKIYIFLLLLLNLKMAQFAIRNFRELQSSGMSATALAKFGVGAGSVGFFSNAGDFGVAMCVVLPLAGMLLLGQKKLVPRIFLLLCFLAFAGAIIACSSRGAVVGAIAVALVALGKNPRRLGAALLFLLFIPGVIYILPEASKERFETTFNLQKDTTGQSRIQFWKAGLRMFHDHPILGVGPGNFPPNYAETYSRPGDDPGQWVPHSIYIQALSELGAPGALMFLLLLLSCFRMNAQTRKRLLEQGPSKKKEFEYNLAMGLDLALVGFMVSGAFLAVLYYPHLWVLLGTSAGLNTAVAIKCAGEKAPDPGETAPGLSLAGASVEGY